MNIKKLFRLILLYILVGMTSIITIVVLGMIGLPNNIGGKIVLWLIAGFISYSIYVFIPFFKMKEKRYYNGFLLAWSYIVIIIVISFRTNNFEEYDYFTAFSFLSGLPIISELFLIFRRKSNSRQDGNYKDVIVNKFKNVDNFVLLDVTRLLNITEHIARRTLKEMINEGSIEANKIGNKYFYTIIY